jgi:hypothetical protein
MPNNTSKNSFTELFKKKIASRSDCIKMPSPSACFKPLRCFMPAEEGHGDFEYTRICAFKSGHSGLKLKQSSGKVTGVGEFGQAFEQGIQKGWTVISINENKYSFERSLTARKSHYSLTFGFHHPCYTVIFQSGSTGIIVERSSGIVITIDEKSQAENLGIEIGWKIISIQAKKYSISKWNKYSHSNSPYYVTFTSEHPSEEKFPLNACAPLEMQNIIKIESIYEEPSFESEIIYKVPKSPILKNKAVMGSESESISEDSNGFEYPQGHREMNIIPKPEDKIYDFFPLKSSQKLIEIEPFYVTPSLSKSPEVELNKKLFGYENEFDSPVEEMLIGDPDGFHGPIDDSLIENRQLELATHLLEYDMPVENENLMSVEDEILLASTREIRMLQQALRTDQNLRELDNDFPNEESTSLDDMEDVSFLGHQSPQPEKILRCAPAKVSIESRSSDLTKMGALTAKMNSLTSQMTRMKEEESNSHSVTKEQIPKRAGSARRARRARRARTGRA